MALLVIFDFMDRRLKALLELLKQRYAAISYSDNIKNEKIDAIVLPFSGLDEFGYLKNTTISLEQFLQNHQVNLVFTGRVNKALEALRQKFLFSIINFYDDATFKELDFYHRIDVAKFILIKEFDKSISDISIAVYGDEKIKNDAVIKMCGATNYQAGNMYDVIINTSVGKLLNITATCNVLIDLSYYPYGLDLLCLKDQNINYYLIDQYLGHYLTKSGGKILYDCMVKYLDCL